MLNKIIWMVRALIYKPFMKRFGGFSYLGKPIFVSNLRAMCIGSKVRIYPLARIEVMKGGALTIGDDVSIGQCLHIVSGRHIVIGSGVTISANVFISDVEHSYEEIGTHIMNQPLFASETHIGENTFLGYGAVIRAGTILGRQCIVGANSVVKGNFPDFCVIAGNPARIIKMYNNESGKWERYR